MLLVDGGLSGGSDPKLHAQCPRLFVLHRAGKLILFLVWMRDIAVSTDRDALLGLNAGMTFSDVGKVDGMRRNGLPNHPR